MYSTSEAVSYLDRSVHDAAAETAGEYDWAEREQIADAVHAAVDDDVATLETSRLEEGVAYDVAYNSTAAANWTQAN